MRKAALLLAVLVLLLPNQGHAQWAVYDAGNWAQNHAQLVAALRNVAIAVQTYKQVMQSYQLAYSMSVPIAGLSGQYPLSVVSQQYLLTPAMACISCGAWATAANTGAAPGPTYGGAVSRLSDQSAALSMMSPAAQAAYQARLANSLYLPDAAVRADLAALSAARVNDPQFQQYVDQCRRNSVDESLVSQIQVGQSSASCAAVLAQASTNTNTLLGRLVEDASIRKAHELDAATERFNSEAAHAAAFNDVPRRTAGTDAAIEQMFRSLIQ